MDSMKNIKYILLVILSVSLFFSCRDSLTETEEVNEIEEKNSGFNNDLFEWETAEPEDYGFNKSLLETADAEADSRNFINSLLVVKNGRLVFEKYYNNFQRIESQQQMQITHAYISALTGIAIHDGLLNISNTLADFFPDNAFETNDDRMKSVTIENLLTMRAGFAGDSDLSSLFFSSNNETEFLLSRNLISAPGSDYQYSSYSIHLLGAILEKVSGKDLDDYANEKLFTKTGMNTGSWNTGNDGINYSHGNFYVSPRNMAKFALAFTQNGWFLDSQVIPSGWVNSTKIDKSGFPETAYFGAVTELGYGYLWFSGRMRSLQVFFAKGYGGQFIFVFPQIEMAVVTTADINVSEISAENHEKSVTELVNNYILTSITVN